jgi:hypothetical protein
MEKNDLNIRSKKQSSHVIATTVRAIKTKYIALDKQLRSTKIAYAEINLAELIRAECRKNKIPEKTIREITKWQNKISILNNDTDD